MSDNRLFNVNGDSKEMLGDALRLAFTQEGKNTTAVSYIVDPKKGLILFWYTETGSNQFLSKLKSDAATAIVWEWLQEQKPENFELGDWEYDCDHDGENSIGWRVYCEDWGHVANKHGAIVAIKPVYLWHGK